jgi:hypothetical protein
VTELIYKARENCLELVRAEATRFGAERVIGNRLQIRELGGGLVEVVALGTAVRRANDMAPETPQLIPQAVITDKSSEAAASSVQGLSMGMAPMGQARARVGNAGALVSILIVLSFFVITCCAGLISFLASQ